MWEDVAGAVFWLLVGLGLLAWAFIPHSWTNAIWYGVKYNVPVAQVYTSNKPSDCDWTYAPLGNKGDAPIVAQHSNGFVPNQRCGFYEDAFRCAALRNDETAFRDDDARNAQSGILTST